MGLKIGASFRQFVSDWWSNFGPMLGAILGSKPAKRRQDEPRKDIKSFKLPKIAFTKSVISQCKNHTFRVLEAPKTIIRGSGMLPKGIWRASGPQKEGRPKMDAKIVFFKASFGVYLGTKVDPNIGLKLTQKLNRNHANILMTNAKQYWFCIRKQ